MPAENHSPTDTSGFADISVTSKSAPYTAQPEDMLTFIFTIINNGPSVADGVTFMASRPFGLSCICISVDGGCTFEPWIGSYVIGKMHGNDTHEVILRGVVDIDIDGIIKLNVRVAAKTLDSDLSNNVTVIKTVIQPQRAQEDVDDTSAAYLQRLDYLIKRLTKAVAKLEAIAQGKLNCPALP